MPLTWVDPAILVQYRGLTVYYTYKNDDINNQSEVWFSLNDDGTDAFDVRDLPVPDYISEMDYKKIVMNAIDQGNLAEYIALLEKGSLQTLIIPSVWTDLEFHLLLAFADKYNNYIKQANRENENLTGWRPVMMDEFYDTYFRTYLIDLLV